MRRSAAVGLCAAAGLVASFLWWAQYYLTTFSSEAAVSFFVGTGQQKQHNTSVAIAQRENTTAISTAQQEDRCAICLFGLPRAFESLVLPSLIENVLKPNARHNCDYFVHYYNVTFEPSGRSGLGGRIDPGEILKLETEVQKVQASIKVPVSSRPPPGVVVRFASETSDDFWRRRGDLVNEVRMANDTKGRFLYFPWRDNTYLHPTTTDNILKMWHSIQESWNLMQSHANATGVPYRRVAVLRSDVLYVTPIDVWKLPSGRRDLNNSVVVIPGFGRYPVSDRLVYGPTEAVKIWASERFDRLEGHIRWTVMNNPGMGLHSETFVKRALLNPIKELGFSVVEHPAMCFVRARADESLWINDCVFNAIKSVRERFKMPSVQGRVEAMLRRTCYVRPSGKEIDCPRIVTNASWLANGSSGNRTDVKR